MSDRFNPLLIEKRSPWSIWSGESDAFRQTGDVPKGTKVDERDFTGLNSIDVKKRTRGTVSWHRVPHRRKRFRAPTPVEGGRTPKAVAAIFCRR